MEVDVGEYTLPDGLLLPSNRSNRGYKFGHMRVLQNCKERHLKYEYTENLESRDVAHVSRLRLHGQRVGY